MADLSRRDPPESPEEWLSWTTTRQAEASNPDFFAWVSANAGSGKTHVLTQRVIRLLLSGAPPASILCLTYTKAAASEMSNRVFKTLSDWTLLDDASLTREIKRMEAGGEPSRDTLMKARRLFARALETPGGLKIQTIHAFCEALLHQFPLEANVAGHFSVLDDRGSADLLAEIKRNLFVAATAEDDRALVDAFATVMDYGSDSGLETLVADILSQRSALERFETHAARHGGPEQALRTFLGLDASEDRDSVRAGFSHLAGFDDGAMRAYIDFAGRVGGSTVQETAQKLAAALATSDLDLRASLLTDAFFKKDGMARSDRSFFNKAMITADPGIEMRFRQAVEAIGTLKDKLKALDLLEATLAALSIANRLNHDYEALKKRLGHLDFEDLIEKAAALLIKSDAGPWIHYKLDQGIDHILVDEAQDTSPVQWRIIKALSDEFFAGEGARGQHRTLFAVGDEKQSIYSFQGARPEKFAGEGRDAAGRARDADVAFRHISLPLSFRSTSHVLSAVDQVFSVEANRRGLSTLGDDVIHQSSRQGHPGMTAVWEIIAPAETQDEDDWTLPFDATPESTPPAILARRIADTIAGWLENREVIIEKNKARPIRAGDILVLVRKRDGFANALTRALKTRNNIPVGGADRLVLTQHIAIQDLMAIGRFLLLEEDDLSLAAFSKSPLINIGEDALMLAAAGRPRQKSLWQRYKALADEGNAAFRLAVETINGWRSLADRCNPFELFSRILGPLAGRRKFQARLGSEVNDVLDEFLSVALDHEQNGLPGLQAFISSLELEPPTVKREQDKDRDEVRIMTVHASKGLEAPVVFLIDDCSAPFNANHLPKLRLMEQADPLPDLPLWLADSDMNIARTKEDAERRKTLAEEEYRRLLYVGMTRAADRLIVCGHRKKREPGECWHRMVWEALSLDPERCRQKTFGTAYEEWNGLVWQSGDTERQFKPENIAEENKADIRLPDSLLTPLPPIAHLPRPLSPSGAAAVLDDEAPVLPAGSRLFGGTGDAANAARRGRMIHRLFQVLPGLAEPERRSAAQRYLERAAPQWSEDERLSTIEQVFSVLADPVLAPLFGPDARAEASIMGVLTLAGRDYAVSGRIDRMMVGEDRVVIADFKTDRRPPGDPGRIPQAYVTQLAIYRSILQPLYPQKRVDCCLIFSTSGRSFAISDTVLDEAIRQFA